MCIFKRKKNKNRKKTLFRVKSLNGLEVACRLINDGENVEVTYNECPYTHEEVFDAVKKEIIPNVRKYFDEINRR